MQLEWQSGANAHLRFAEGTRKAEMATVLDSFTDLGAGVAIVGGGLVGCLLGIYLRKHGFSVTIYESRSDPRLHADTGRSINLILTSRGIATLMGASDAVAARVMAITVPVFGRTLHSVQGARAYQPYGPDRSYCNFSVSRWELNTVLMSAAEEAGCVIVFNHPLAHLDVSRGHLFFYLQDATTTQLYQKMVKCAHVFATDGGGSRCRQALKGLLGPQMQDKADPLRYGYKELTMARPPASAGMALDTLHIWPRGTHFMMALPNRDGSNTMTLYMPESGSHISFAALNTPAKIKAYFEEFYPDAVSLMPHFVDEYTRNPTGFLGTVFSAPWHFQDRLLLLGDAAHAITPFFGQGCNLGFEDVMVLDAVLRATKSRDMGVVFAEVYRQRKPDADAMAYMAIENFTEMMSKTASEKFLLEKAIEIELSNRFPEQYASRYMLVTHSLVPYHKCMQIGVLQQKILSELARDISDVSKLNFALAKRLIEQEIVPFLKRNKITAKDFNYTCKFYPKAKL